jgi:hypothetical protein
MGIGAGIWSNALDIVPVMEKGAILVILEAETRCIRDSLTQRLRPEGMCVKRTNQANTVLSIRLLLVSISIGWVEGEMALMFLHLIRD